MARFLVTYTRPVEQHIGSADLEAADSGEAQRLADEQAAAHYPSSLKVRATVTEHIEPKGEPELVIVPVVKKPAARPARRPSFRRVGKG